jgi:hypothetical protein
MAEVVAVVVVNMISNICKGTVKLNHYLFHEATVILLSSCVIWFKPPTDSSLSISILTSLNYSNPVCNFSLG